KTSQGDLANQVVDLILGQRTRHVGIYKPWGHTVYRDVTATHLAGQGPCQASNTGLGSGIIALPSIATIAYHRAYVDYTTPARFHRRAQHPATKAKNGAQIGRQDGIKILIGKAHGQAVTGNARIINQHMGAALFGQLGQKGITGLAVIDIQGNPAPTLGGQLLLNLSSTFGAGGGTDDLRRSEEHTSELQSRFDLVCRLLL